MSTTHLTLRHRNILANLGARRPETATPYVDRARIDTIVAAEHFRAQRAQAKRPHEGPPTPTRAARWLNSYKTALRIAGSALYSFAGVCIGAGALAVLLAKQPVLDAETERANAAEAHAAKLASTLQAVGGGHVTVNLTGPAHQVARAARAAQAASALIWIDEAANVKHAATLTRGGREMSKAINWGDMKRVLISVGADHTGHRWYCEMNSAANKTLKPPLAANLSSVNDAPQKILNEATGEVVAESPPVEWLTRHGGDCPPQFVLEAPREFFRADVPDYTGPVK